VNFHCFAQKAHLSEITGCPKSGIVQVIEKHFAIIKTTTNMKKE
jgi:hypothetical protein